MAANLSAIITEITQGHQRVLCRREQGVMLRCSELWTINGPGGNTEKQLGGKEEVKQLGM